MYILVKDHFVFYGPNRWNPEMIKSYFEDDYDGELTVPATAPVGGTGIGNGVIVYEFGGQDELNYNPKIQKLHGPFYRYEVGKAFQTFEVHNKELDQVRQELKAVVAENRWKKEISGTTVTIQGQQIQLSTQRGERDIFAQALSLGTETDWKLSSDTGTVWLFLSIADLTAVVNAIVSHIKSSFDLEKAKSQEIDSATTLADLDNIVLEL